MTRSWTEDNSQVLLGSHKTRAHKALIILSLENSKFGTNSSKHSRATKGADSIMNGPEIRKSEVLNICSSKDNFIVSKTFCNESSNQKLILHKLNVSAFYSTKSLTRKIAVQKHLQCTCKGRVAHGQRLSKLKNREQPSGKSIW